MFTDVLTEIAVILLFATCVGAIGVRLRQPLIISFILVGIVLGPSVLDWVGANDNVDLLARLGITLLLFVVGLKLDFHIIRSMGLVAITTGLGQIVFTSVVGYLIALALGIPSVNALYIAVALTFSSTIIIVKLLSDKREIDTLHGRIALGFLIVQDLIVVLVMIGLNAFGETGNVSMTYALLMVFIKGAAFILVIAGIARYVLPRMLSMFSYSQELLVLFGIAWAVALATFGVWLGFSKEVGAFIAGVSLASTPYRDVLGARLVGLRDFLLLFFFIDLGARMELSLLGAQLSNSVIFSLFVLIGNPLIVIIIMGVLGYRKRTGFLSGLAVAQISEFSLILAALGLSLGHIDTETMGLITLVGLITISTSTYMIIYSQSLYKLLAPGLTVFERRLPYREIDQGVSFDDSRSEIILIGLGRFGSAIMSTLRDRGCQVIGVDFNPHIQRKDNISDSHVVFGDAEDPEFIGLLPTENARWVVCTVRDLHVSQVLIYTLRHIGYTGQIAVTAHSSDDVTKLEAMGASFVMTPFPDAAREAADRLLGQGGVLQ